MSNWEWNRKIKARKLDPERGQIIAEFQVKDILSEPNRFQIEAIIQAIGIAASELIRLEEDRYTTMNRMIGAMNAKNKVEEEAREKA